MMDAGVFIVTMRELNANIHPYKIHVKQDYKIATRCCQSLRRSVIIVLPFSSRFGEIFPSFHTIIYITSRYDIIVGALVGCHDEYTPSSQSHHLQFPRFVATNTRLLMVVSRTHKKREAPISPIDHSKDSRGQDSSKFWPSMTIPIPTDNCGRVRIAIFLYYDINNYSYPTIYLAFHNMHK